MKKVKCASCGYEKELANDTISDLERNGFEAIWDVLNGLTNNQYVQTVMKKYKHTSEQLKK